MGNMKVEEIINTQPRENWKKLIKPHIKRNKRDCCFSYMDEVNDPWSSFALKMLKPDYQCKYNIGDFVYCKDNNLCIIVRLPNLDIRCKDIDIKPGRLGEVMCIYGGSVGLIGINTKENVLCMSSCNKGIDLYEEFSTLSFIKRAKKIELKEYEFLSLILKITKEYLTDLDNNYTNKLSILYDSIEQYQDKFTYELGVEMEKALYDEFYNYYKSKISNI